MDPTQTNPPGSDRMPKPQSSVPWHPAAECCSPRPVAQPVKPDPALMSEPQLPPDIQGHPPRPELDPFPPLSHFGIAPDLNLQFNLETLNVVLRVLFPTDPFTRGILYAKTLDNLRRYLQDQHTL